MVLSTVNILLVAAIAQILDFLVATVTWNHVLSASMEVNRWEKMVRTANVNVLTSTKENNVRKPGSATLRV